MSTKKERDSFARAAFTSGTHHPIFSVSRHSKRQSRPLGKWVWLFWIVTIIAFIITESGLIHFRPWQYRFLAFIPSVILLGVSVIPSFASSRDPLKRRWGSLLVITLFLALALGYVYVSPVRVLSEFLYVCAFVILFLFLRNLCRRFNLFIESIIVSVNEHGYMIMYGGSWVWLILMLFGIAYFIWWPLAFLLTIFLVAIKGIHVIRGPAVHPKVKDLLPSER